MSHVYGSDNALERLNSQIRAVNAGKRLSKAQRADMEFVYMMFADNWRKQGHHVEILKGV